MADTVLTTGNCVLPSQSGLPTQLYAVHLPTHSNHIVITVSCDLSQAVSDVIYYCVLYSVMVPGHGATDIAGLDK